MNETHIITALVENAPGVLQKVANMFRSKGFNINSISVGEAEKKDLARMTITVSGDEKTVEHVVKRLRGLIDIVEVEPLEPSTSVYRELALVKLKTPDSKAKSEAITYANIFRCHIVDVSKESITVELTGTPDKIDAFARLGEELGVERISRTGITALPRG